MTNSSKKPAEQSVSHLPKIRWASGLILLAIAILGLFFLLAQLLQKDPAQAPVSSRNIEKAQFVENETCRDCHVHQFAEWLGSHHEQSMKEANSETVVGDFDDAEMTHFGMTSRFFKRENRFFVLTEGPGGDLAEYEIKYTFGIDPLQQYLIEFPGGRLQSLTIAWDTVGKRWFHLYPDEKIAHDDPLHWTGRYQTWNYMCAECHSTNLRKNYDRSTDSYDTAWDEINVSCQACHGPGSLHVQWARSAEKENQSTRRDYGLVVDLTESSERQLDACARCHSRRHAVSPEDGHGRPFLDDFMPSLLTEGLYHPDGQILEEVYVYGSFVQSKMYREGVRCTDCHNPHTARLWSGGNNVCTQCHQESPPARFPSLKGKNYDVPAHHFHKAGGEGARCVSCHMPSRTYMGVDPRRDHSFRIPRPDLSTRIGTPNACNDCHRERSAGWAESYLQKWYGFRTRDSEYAEALAAARSGGESVSSLIRIAGDSQQLPIARATALEMLRPHAGQADSVIRAAVRADRPLVRYGAVRSAEFLEPRARLEIAAPLLKDPIRGVRVEAARVLSSVPPNYWEGQREAFDSAFAEFKQAQLSMADVPSSHFNLGVVHTNMGRMDLAEKEYKEAIEMDREHLPAYVNLANLLNRTGRNSEALRVFGDAIEQAPEEGELHYSLGLLLAEEQRIEDAVATLADAARLLPERPRVHYNYALALQHLGRHGEAEKAMLQAHRLSPTDRDILQAAAILYMQQGRWGESRPFAEKIVELHPNLPAAREMLQRDRLRTGAG